MNIKDAYFSMVYPLTRHSPTATVCQSKGSQVLVFIYKPDERHDRDIWLHKGFMRISPRSTEKRFVLPKLSSSSQENRHLVLKICIVLYACEIAPYFHGHLSSTRWTQNKIEIDVGT